MPSNDEGKTDNSTESPRIIDEKEFVENLVKGQFAEAELIEASSPSFKLIKASRICRSSDDKTNSEEVDISKNAAVKDDENEHDHDKEQSATDFITTSRSTTETLRKLVDQDIKSSYDHITAAIKKLNSQQLQLEEMKLKYAQNKTLLENASSMDMQTLEKTLNKIKKARRTLEYQLEISNHLESNIDIGDANCQKSQENGSKLSLTPSIAGNEKNNISMTKKTIIDDETKDPKSAKTAISSNKALEIKNRLLGSIEKRKEVLEKKSTKKLSSLSKIKSKFSFGSKKSKTVVVEKTVEITTGAKNSVTTVKRTSVQRNENGSGNSTQLKAVVSSSQNLQNVTKNLESSLQKLTTKLDQEAEEDLAALNDSLESDTPSLEGSTFVVEEANQLESGNKNVQDNSIKTRPRPEDDDDFSDFCLDLLLKMDMNNFSVERKKELLQIFGAQMPEKYWLGFLSLFFFL